MTCITCESRVDRAVECRVKHCLRPCIRRWAKHEAISSAAHSYALIALHDCLVRRWCSVENLHNRIPSIGQSLHAAYISIEVAAQPWQFRLANICKLQKYSCSWGR